MKTFTFNSLSLNYTVSGPADAAEYDKLAGRQNAANDDAVASLAYRSSHAQFREELCTEMEKRTGVKRLVKKVKNEDGSEDIIPAETEQKYVSRVIAAKYNGDREAYKAAFQPVATEISKKLDALDPKVKERKAGAAKALAQKYLQAADEVIAAGGAKKVAAKLAKALGREVGEDKESLAQAIKEDHLAKLAQLSADLLK